MRGTFIGVVIVLSVVAAGIVAMSMDWTGRRGSGLGERFELNLGELRKIPPALITHVQTGTIRTGFVAARGIAVGPGGRIYVAGDQAVRIFDLEGKRLGQINLSRGANCLAVAADGSVYVGAGNRVDVLDAAGEVRDHWPAISDKAIITSIAVGADDVFVADYQSRAVYHYDTSGKLLNKIVPRDEKGRARTFTVSSRYFDVAIRPDGLLAVVNPGEHRIEAYNFAGEFRSGWGRAAAEVAGFAGCCNPAHMALLADGRFVTSERGLPTIKIYSAAGELEGVVATAEMLSRVPTECANPYHNQGLDVAVGPAGEILVLDSGGNVGIFTRREEE